MADESAVEFVSVVRRFGEATEALEELGERIRQIQDDESTRKHATSAISEVSGRLLSTSETIASMCDMLRSALDSMLDALKHAEGLTTGAELRDIRAEVETTRGLAGKLAVDTQALDGRLSDLTAAHRSVGEGIDSKLDELGSAQRTIGERTDSKLSELATEQHSIRASTDLKLTELATEQHSIRSSTDLKLTDLVAGQQSIDEGLHVIRSHVHSDLSDARESLATAHQRLSIVEERLDRVPPRIRSKYELYDF